MKKDATSRGSAAAPTAPQEHAMIASIATAGNHESLSKLMPKEKGIALGLGAQGKTPAASTMPRKAQWNQVSYRDR